MTPSADAVQFELRDVQGWVLKLLQRFGMFAVDADCLVERLLQAQLRGRSQYGLALLPELVAAFEGGDIDPRARTLTVLDLPGFAILDGSTGVGQVAATRAMELALQKARICGVAQVIVRNSQPCADVATIAELAAAADCLGYCTTHSGKAHLPANQESPWLTDHPHAWSLPSGSAALMTCQQQLSPELLTSETGLRWSLGHAAWSQLHTAALTGSRLAEAKKKASPYGAGAEHCCLAWSLSLLKVQEPVQNWAQTQLQRKSLPLQTIPCDPLPQTLEVANSLQAELQSLAQQTRTVFPTAI